MPELVHVLFIVSGVFLGAFMGYVLGSMLSVKKEVHLMYLNAEHFEKCPYITRLHEMAGEGKNTPCT